MNPEQEARFVIALFSSIQSCLTRKGFESA